MGFLDRLTKRDPPMDGAPGSAVVRSVSRPRGYDDRSDMYDLDLEVTLEGRAPYTAVATVAVPKRYWDITENVPLPIKVDKENPKRIVVDWDAFDAAGGKQVVAEHLAQYRRKKAGGPTEQVSQNPVLRQNAQNAVEGWLAGVKGGQITAQEFSGYVDEYVATGMLTAEEGEAAKRAAG